MHVFGHDQGAHSRGERDEGGEAGQLHASAHWNRTKAASRSCSLSGLIFSSKSPFLLFEFSRNLFSKFELG
jgi:hypothetical protein